FTKLTIGDGLVSQVPALLISLAAGLLVTRSGSSSNLPVQFLEQLFGNPRALVVAGVFLVLLIVTNLPTLPMATLGIGCVGLAMVMNRQQTAAATAAEAAEQQRQDAENAPREKRVEDYLSVDPMELAIGMELLSLADPARGGDIMQRVGGVRNQLAGDMGIVMPKVRVRDDATLSPMDYRISISGNPVAAGTLLPGKLLAIDSGQTTGMIEGEPTRDPTFGTPAVWIDPLRREQAAIYGYTTVDPSTVVCTHLHEVVRRHAGELLTRDATKHLIDELREVAPTVVDELIPSTLKLSDVQQVLQRLLDEDVPIRQLSIILETLGDHAGKTKDPIWLCEYVRHRLARTICTRHRDNQNRLHVIAVDPAMEDRIAAGVEQTDRGLFVRMSPSAVEATCASISTAIQSLTERGLPPLVLVSPRIRPALRQLTGPTLPNLRILSYNEISQDTQIESLGVAGD
ncbi:MAG: flagellar biosynthesis protein FlhA, partial [Planctomycetota bacterium]